MSLIPLPTDIQAIAEETYTATEAALKAGNIALPYPAAKALPWGVRTVVAPVDSQGGLWKTEAATKKRAGLAIIASVEQQKDGELWYHVSVSRADKLPSYADLNWVKRLWFGPDRWAIQCFVIEAEHVNIHPYCLHLWHSLTGPQPFPDFRTKEHI